MSRGRDDRRYVFRGMLPLRIASVAMGLIVAGALPYAAITVPRGDATTAEYYSALILMPLLGAGAGFSALALALDYVVVDQHGVHRRNPIWFNRDLQWSEITSDHPVVALFYWHDRLSSSVTTTTPIRQSRP